MRERFCSLKAHLSNVLCQQELCSLLFFAASAVSVLSLLIFTLVRNNNFYNSFKVSTELTAASLFCSVFLCVYEMASVAACSVGSPDFGSLFKLFLVSLFSVVYF